MSKWEKVEVTEILRVSKYGSGLYLRIPMEWAETFGMVKGDKLRVRFEAIWRKPEKKGREVTESEA